MKCIARRGKQLVEKRIGTVILSPSFVILRSPPRPPQNDNSLLFLNKLLGVLGLGCVPKINLFDQGAEMFFRHAPLDF